MPFYRRAPATKLFLLHVILHGDLVLRMSDVIMTFRRPNTRDTCHPTARCPHMFWRSDTKVKPTPADRNTPPTSPTTPTLYRHYRGITGGPSGATGGLDRDMESVHTMHTYTVFNIYIYIYKKRINIDHYPPARHSLLPSPIFYSPRLPFLHL